MTIEQLMKQVGAPSVTALEAKLVEFDLTLADCEGSKAYRQDLTNIFASGLAVVGGGAVATTETPKEAPIAPVVQKKGKGGRMTKAQKVEMAQAQAQAKTASTTSLVDMQSAYQIENARLQVGTINELENELSTYVAGRIVGMDAAIAEKVSLMIDEAGDTCRVDLAGILQRSVDNALDTFYASLAE